MAVSVGDLVAKLRLDGAGFARDLQRQERNLKQFGAEASRVGSLLSRRLTAPLLAAGAASAVMAARFEQSMTKIVTLVGVAEKQVNAWNREVLDLAKSSGRGPKELADALFVVTSAGIRGTESMDVLEASAKAAAVGLGETASIARAVTSAVQAYGKENLSAAQATDIMMATVREGNLEAESLAGTLGRVIGVAANLGISFANVGAFLATFTRLGVSAEEAVTSLRSTLVLLTGSTEEGTKALAEAGLSLEQLRQVAQTEGLPAALQLIVEAFGDNVEQLRLVIPNIRALSGVLGTAGSQGQEFARILDSINDSAGLVDEGFARVQETTASMFNQFKANVSALGIEIGQQLLPLVNVLLKRLTNLADKISELSPDTIEIGISFAAMAVAVAPLLLVLGRLATTASIVASGLGTGLLPVIAVGGPIALGLAALAIGITTLTVKLGSFQKAVDAFGRPGGFLFSYFIDGAKEASEALVRLGDVGALSIEDLRTRQQGLIDTVKRFQEAADNASGALKHNFTRQAQEARRELIILNGIFHQVKGGIDDVAEAAAIAEREAEALRVAEEAAAAAAEKAARLKEQMEAAAAAAKLMADRLREIMGPKRIEHILKGPRITSVPLLSTIKPLDISGLVKAEVARLTRILLGRRGITETGRAGINRLDAGAMRFRTAALPGLGGGQVVPSTSIVKNFESALGKASNAAKDLGTSFIDAFTGAFDPTEFVSNLGANLAGGLISAGVGLISKAFSGLFGPSEEQQKLSAAMKANKDAVDRLRRSIDAQAQAVSGTAGGLLGGAFGVTEAILKTPGAFESQDRFLAASRAALAKAGMTVDDLRRAAEALGLEFHNTQRGVADLFQALRELSIADLFVSFAGQLSRLQASFEIFDISDPIKQLEMYRDLFLKAVELPEGLEDTIRSLDLTTAAGRERLQEVIKQLFQDFIGGDMTLGELGEMGAQEFLDFLLSMEGLGDQIDSTADAFNELNRELSNVPHGFKIALRTFQATVGVPWTTRTDPPGGGQIIPGGITPSFSVGVLNIETSGGETGAEVLDKIEREVRRRARQGGTSNLDLSRLQR